MGRAHDARVALERSVMSTPMPARVVIVGGGIAGLEVLLALRELAPDLADVEVLSPTSTFHYRPLDVVRPFGLESVLDLDLAELIRSGGARHRLGSLASVDLQRKVVQTESGRHLSYDALVLACGAHRRPALEGVLTFRGASDIAALRTLLGRLGERSSTLAFVLPSGTTWELPLYELAFMTARTVAERPGNRRTELVLVTLEAAPLHRFGAEASKAVSVLLEREGIRVYTQARVESYGDGRLHLLPRGELKADDVVAMPVIEGPSIPGLPHDEHGFIPTDAFGRVEGLRDVYAAGDVTAYPIKQGGLASQHADVVATTLAAWLGANVQPAPLRPILRAQLLTAGAPRFFEVELGERGDVCTVSFDPPCSPAAKITARYSTPFLAARGVGDPFAAPHARAHE